MGSPLLFSSAASNLRSSNSDWIFISSELCLKIASRRAACSFKSEAAWSRSRVFRLGGGAAKLTTLSNFASIDNLAPQQGHSTDISLFFDCAMISPRNFPKFHIQNTGYRIQHATALLTCISVIINRQIMWVGASALTLWRCPAWSESVGVKAPIHMFLSTL